MKPLHWRVAEALGWSHLEPGNTLNLHDPGVGYPPTGAVVGQKTLIPRFDGSWGDTGLVIERLNIYLGPIAGGAGLDWVAWWVDSSGKRIRGYGSTPLVAVCILALAEAGEL